MPTVCLIDASPYIFRAYYSIPSTMVSPDGRVTNAVYGFAEFLLQVVKKANPDYLAVCFDGSLTTSFRNEIYPAYKAHREPPPPELVMQIQSCQDVATALGMRCFIDGRFESDDLIGTLLSQLRNPDLRFVIVSNDKDLMQLVDKQVTFWDFARDERFDDEAVKAKLGVKPEQIIDYLALAGDSVDNIPGVTGVGPKTARSLLQNFDTLTMIYRDLQAVSELPLRGARAIVDRLREGKEMAFLSRTLATIATDAPVQAVLQNISYAGADAEQVEPLFERLGFDAIKSRIPAWQ